MRPHVIPLLLVPTVAAMLIAAVQQPPQRSLLALIGWTVLGGTLAAGGAHAINQYLDRDIDARMRRTSHRAVVTGRIAPGRALAFGIALSALGFAQLWLTVNAAAALLAVAGNLFYVFVYTLWLKRTSVQNIVIGGAAGAVPPLVGWAAVTGEVGLPALLFFAIIFFWTPAHCWALALVRQEDYREAGIPMLPVVRGEATTRAGILRYALLLVGATLLPVAIQALGGVYLLAAGGLGVVLVSRAVEIARLRSPALAWRLIKFSNNYQPLLYLAMVVDRLLAWAGGLRL
jgi:protoheme IX farnesyltransferase